MRKAVIENGVVTNIIVADDSFTLNGDQIISIDDKVVEIGYACKEIDGEFIFLKHDTGILEPTFEELQIEQNVDFDYRLSLLEMGLV